MPNDSWDMSKSWPNFSGRVLSTSGISQLLISDSTIAPRTTPQIEPRPPRMTMPRIRIEK